MDHYHSNSLLVGGLMIVLAIDGIVPWCGSDARPG